MEHLKILIANKQHILTIAPDEKNLKDLNNLIKDYTNMILFDEVKMADVEKDLAKEAINFDKIKDKFNKISIKKTDTKRKEFNITGTKQIIDYFNKNNA